MCFPFYPQESGVNKEGEWKVVFAMTQNGLKTNCKYVACGGWETGSGLEETRKSDSSHYHQPSSTDKVKFFVFVCLENVYVHGISV